MTYSRLGADIGGTFTDFVLSDAAGENDLKLQNAVHAV